MKIKNSSLNQIPKTWSSLNKIIKNKKIELTKEIKNDLQIYILTWNIHGKMPLKNHLEIILPKDKNYDMYIISTQECMRSISASFLNDSKDEWINLLKEYFGDEYINLINENLSAFHISVFINFKIKNKFKNLQVSKVKTGFLNVMSNKGAVAVAMEYLNKKLCFICCHLTHGYKYIQKRNDDFKRINQELIFTPYEDNKNIIENNNINKTDYFDIVFWTGDFNYNLNSNKDEILKMIHDKNYFKLKELDQLTQEIKSNRIDINNFEEGEIHFFPTYKYKEESDDYVLNNRIPSFTDRIFYKVKKINDLKLCEYNCINEIKYSDHKPVYAIFDLNYSENKSTIVYIKKEKACCIF